LPKPEEQPLPPEDHKDFFRALVHNCIVTYGRIFNDKLALDYNQVTGKLRPMVLDDPEYRKETRSMLAKAKIDEVEKIDGLLDDINSEYSGGDGYEFRDRKGKKSLSPAMTKDMLTFKMKLNSDRRDLLFRDDEDKELDESNGLNMFFVPVTREDLNNLSKVEIYIPKDTGADLGKLEAEDDVPVS
jgi:hypothetical protein